MARQRLRRAALAVKYEEVYLRAYDAVSDARTSISKYLAFYNSGRPHSSLDRMTPDGGLLQCAGANPGSGTTKAEIHLPNPRRLFRQTEPPLSLLMIFSVDVERVEGVSCGRLQ